MTRLEQPAPAAPVDREEIGRIMRRELFMDIFRRKLMGCLAFVAIALTVILVPAGFVAGAAAKTGLVHVPLLSEWLYRPSEPLRTVTPYSGTTVEDVLRSIGRHSRYDLRTGVAAVPVTEKELTTILSAAIAGSGDSIWRDGLASAQAAVEPGIVELFAELPQTSEDATLRVRFLPTVVDGRLNLEIRDFRIGSLDVAPSIAELVAGRLVAPLTDALQQELGGAGRILGVSAEPGELIVTLAPTK